MAMTLREEFKKIISCHGNPCKFPPDEWHKVTCEDCQLDDLVAAAKKHFSKGIDEALNSGDGTYKP